jgi:Druantia protein DruA
VGLQNFFGLGRFISGLRARLLLKLPVMDPLLVQGRTIDSADLDWIRELMMSHPQWGRYHLSLHLAQQWDWHNGLGRLKDMAARTLLLKLERRGLIKLPPRQRSGSGNHKARKVEPDLAPQLELGSPEAISPALAELLPLELVCVETPQQRRIFGRLLQQHHYLGYYRPVGENVSYLVQGRGEGLVGCALFGAAAWKCAPRDRHIGWTDQARQAHLQGLANNMRLLVLPWIRVRSLASHLLSAVVQRVSADWQRKYGHPIFLLETFVDQERFAGTVYRAANWIHVGQSQGRGRQGPAPHIRSASIKDVYLWPLHARFREHLHGRNPVQGPERSSRRSLSDCLTHDYPTSLAKRCRAEKACDPGPSHYPDLYSKAQDP